MQSTDKNMESICRMNPMPTLSRSFADDHLESLGFLGINLSAIDGFIAAVNNLAFGFVFVFVFIRHT